MIFNAELGLNAIEWTVIARVGKEAEFTQAQLATAGSHDKGQISRAVQRLQRRKLLKRDGSAGRAVPLRLTAAGSRVYESIVRISAKRRIELERGISARDLKCFCKVLDIIAVNVEELLQR
jgi:DNA-binding MarR family transcriptional regulator